MSFSHAIKKEILAQEFSVEQADAFISGLVASSGIRDGSRQIVKLNDEEIAESIRNMINQMKVKHELSKNNRNWIVFENYEPTRDVKMPGYFFAGIFVGGGSVSDPLSTSYHLEMQFYSMTLAQKVQQFLNDYDFKFSLIQRRNNWVLYLKKADMITDFLKVVQAFNSVLEFEDARINRDFKNQLNRYSNLDMYNQSKLAKTSQRFNKQYQFIKEHNLLGLFRESEIDFFELKKANPYSSLEELTTLFEKKTGIKKTRAGLSHYLIKMRSIIENEQ